MLDAYSTAVTQAVGHAGPSVLHVRAHQNGRRSGSGSGFLISPDGFVVTNSHVVNGASRLTVQTSDARESVAELVGDDPDTDLAVLRINLPGLQHVKFAPAPQIRVGQIAIAIGNPLGFDHTVTAGITRRINPHLRVNVKCAYSQYNDWASGGNNNTTAEMVYTSLQ